MKKINQLAGEISPYLEQHASNPVDWHPWGNAALQLARDQHKPILLSIGYAACHWCHVMAHESFEDQETAEIMNRYFINIKVDREERPDLDKIYQTANYFLTQRQGGWPLTLFLAPDDLTPFFSGTYFPREAKYNLPAFKEILLTIADIYKNNFASIKQQNNELSKLLRHQADSEHNGNLDKEIFALALSLLERNFDHANGGFGRAPKFPHPTMLKFLLETNALLATKALTSMAQGGIYDQLGGGFFRYTVDEKWQIPHFEKMLYDNALLLALYAEASVQEKNSFFATIAREVADWVIGKMQSPAGGYYSSLDADSEGHEGLFYIWKKTEIEPLLTHSEYQLICLYYGLDHSSNFEGQWHLHIARDLQSVALRLGMSLDEATKQWISAKEKLIAARQKKIAPACDRKILTAWNGLMIKGMVLAGDLLEEPRYVESARQALNYIRQHLWKNKMLLASGKNEKAHLSAYLDDYAYLLDALITLLQISWRTEDLRFAIELAEYLLAHFTDSTRGGFYFTADGEEIILYRPKTMMDEAVPAGNGIAAQAFLQLGYLLGETRYLDAAEQTLKAASLLLAKFPADHCSLLLALKEQRDPSTVVVIRGLEKEASIWREICKENGKFRVFTIPSSESDLPSGLKEKVPTADICAYVCKGTMCLSVIENLDELKKMIIKNG
jgi:uncharacterized protein YyaL (SSP411 family)